MSECLFISSIEVYIGFTGNKSSLNTDLELSLNLCNEIQDFNLNICNEIFLNIQDQRGD